MPARRRFAAIAALALGGVLLRPAAAVADSPDGSWRVSGAVSGFRFEVVCRLVADAGRVSGACVDGATSDPALATGRRHLITDGASEGARVRWRYASRFLLTPFEVDFDGVRSGDEMRGAVRAGGRTGVFTAARVGP